MTSLCDGLDAVRRGEGRVELVNMMLSPVVYGLCLVAQCVRVGDALGLYCLVRPMS